MKKIVPFKKDIVFDTNLAEITSISLEHTLKRESDNVFSGEFIISGNYKITDVSINVDSFNHQLPFTIDIDEIYDTSKANIDIDDFYYEIINNNALRVHIDVCIDNLEDAIIEVEEANFREIIEELKEEVLEVPDELIVEEIIDERKEEIMKEEEMSIMGKVENLAMDAIEVAEDVVHEVVEVTSDKATNFVKSLFDKIDDADEDYATYHVYIVREGDSVEHVMNKYNVSREDLDLYNDLNDIKIGDKIIIPSIHATNQ